MEEEEEAKRKKRKIDLDWNKLLPSDQQDDTDEPPPLLILPPSMGGGEHFDDDIQAMTDSALDDSIRSKRESYDMLAPKLPDNGAKLMLKIRRLEEEKERRESRRHLKDDGGGEKRTQSHSPHINGASCGFGQGATSSLPQSQFGSHFCRKMEENQADCRTVDAFDKQLSALGCCDRARMRQNGGNYRSGLTSRQTAFQSPSFLSVDVDKQNVSNGVLKGRDSSPDSPPNIEEDMSGSCKKRNAPKLHPSNNLRPRNGQTVVVVDEEEAQLLETEQQEEKMDDCIKATKIYYPSRDDPKSVEICYADMECLAPETYLSSPIMNFYIRYLQQPTSATDRARCSYHFFTTYFYEKLKEAVPKMGDKEELFSKFRRWWKGVNIFEKAYIFLPINENHHWSLVIICNPDKDVDSGPILLHLDSLGIHSSRSIFVHIKSFLKKEWNYLNQQEASSDYPISSRIWQNLPRRIDEKTITVPQQKNKYDCGLFVLFFIERFIEEAPQRLKKKNLVMFGKQWFNPKEASDLRLKIQRLLMKEFMKESKDRSALKPP